MDMVKGLTIVSFCLLGWVWLYAAQAREKSPGWEKLFEKKATHNIRRLSPEEIKYLEGIKFITIPNDKLILIWEHSCIKHLLKGEIQRAREVKETIEWQRTNKKGLDFMDDSQGRDIEEYQRHYREAIAAKEKMGSQWICDPPVSRFELTQLNVGRDISTDSLPPESFLTEKGDKVLIEATARILDACEACRIDWFFSFPNHEKESVRLDGQT